MSEDKKKLHMEKQQFSLKNMYFNRYLIVRYLTALFFFINLYWLICLSLSKSIWLWLPLALIVGVIPVAAEQFQLYRKHQNNVPNTDRYFLIQGILNLVLMFVTVTPLFSGFFPFMNEDGQGRVFISVLMASGLLLCVFVRRRLKRIRTNRDKHYDRIQQYEKAVQ